MDYNKKLMSSSLLIIFSVLLFISGCSKKQIHPIVGKWDYNETIQVEEGVYLLWEIEISEDKFMYADRKHLKPQASRRCQARSIHRRQHAS